MKNQVEKSQYKKILEYIMKQQTSISAFRAFLKNTAEGEEKSFTKEIAEVCNKLKVKEITKMTSHFSIHTMEAEQLPNTIQIIEQKMYYWIDELMEQLKQLKDKAKNMEAKWNKIQESQINNYKAQLTKELIAINQKKQSLVKLFCHISIKNNSQQVQRITDLLKNEFQLANREKKQKE